MKYELMLAASVVVLAVSCQNSVHDANEATVHAAAAGRGQGGVSGGTGPSPLGGSMTSGVGAGGNTSGGAAPRLPQLSVGPFSACVVGSDQGVKCAGKCGKPGRGGSRDQAPFGLTASAVAVGRDFSCVLLTVPGGVRCWGAGAAAEPPASTDAVELVAADDHACIRSTSGAVNCWGNEAHTAPAGIVAKGLAASGAMTCAIISDDSLRCWGPQVAEPPADLRAESLALSSQLSDARQGSRFGCAIAVGGEVRCFGDDVGGVLKAPRDLRATKVALGRSNGCAIALDDSVRCWGTPPAFGLAPPPDLKAVALSLSFRSAGAVTRDGQVVWWGDSNEGQGGLP